MKKIAILCMGLLWLNQLSAQLSVQAINSPYLIDFDNSVSGVNQNQWNGGLFNLNVGSFLNSNAWEIVGFSDGVANYGDVNIAPGDFYNSPTSNFPLIGGLWPFGVGGVWNNRVLGIRPSSEDFTDGTITLRITNATMDTIEQVRIEYDIFSRNDKDISNSLNSSFSEDNSSFQSLSTLDFATPAASGSTAWDSVHRDTTVNVTWLNGTFFYLRWHSDSLSGTGTGLNLGDILGIDNIRITALSGPPIHVTSVDDSLICLDSTAGDSVLVNYNATVTYGLGNVFSVELSDSAGDFTNPLVIGTLADTTSTGSIASHLPAGLSIGTEYRIRVVASQPLGYSVISPFALVISETPAVAVDVQNITCFGDQDGSIQLFPELGVTPYTYLWSTTDTTQNLDALSDGIYSVEVTEVHGCSVALDSIEVLEPAPWQTDVTITESLCFGDDQASIALAIAGGTPSSSGYQYNWDNGGTTPTLNDLPVGSYAVTITDSLGCTTDTSIVVNQPEELAFGHVATDPNCYGIENGSIFLFPTGGTSPLTYTWSTGASNDNLTGLGSGSYSVTITDDNNCEAEEQNIVLTEPDSLQVGVAASDASCPTCTDGSIQVVVSGATPPYDFIWSNGAITQNADGLLPGTYTLTITDDNGCEHIVEQSVEGPVGLADQRASNTQIKVFPNPATASAVQLSFGIGMTVQNVVLVNHLGQEFLVQGTRSANGMELQLGDLPNGLYRLLCRFEDGHTESLALTLHR